MKNNTLLLLKNNIINAYKIKKVTKKKLIGYIIFGIYLIACVGISIGMMTNGLYKALDEQQMTSYYIPLLFSIASLFIFVFSIFSAKSSLFDNKDNDLLLSLPIKRSNILTSRLLMIIIYNFVLGLMFIIPGLVVYFKYASLTLIAIVSIILLILFFAIIPTILSSLFGYLIATLSSKTNAKSMFELIYYTIFIFIYIIIMTNGNKILDMFVNNIDVLNTLLKTIFAPIYLMAVGLTTNNILYIFAFALINIIALILFITVLNKSYFKIIFKLNTHKTNHNFILQKSNTKSIRKTLLEKEFKKYFSSAIYVFNTIFGSVIILIAAIASFFYSKDTLIKLINIDSTMPTISVVYILVVFVVSLTITTNSSISIEKDNFWILKMIPVSTKEIFNSKLLLNRIILIPITLIAIILFNINSYINITETINLFILTIFYGLFISNFGLIINLLFPKFDAVNDTVIVKQSTASFVSIMGGMVFCIIMIITSNMVNNSQPVIISIFFSIVLYIISKIILSKWGIKKFEKI